jgi:hypothetical protein
MNKVAAQKGDRPRLDFNALYLDTNVLVELNWPAPSVKLENLFTLALWSKVAVFLPSPVEKEVQEHWLRGVRERLAGLESAKDQFERITRQVTGTAEVRYESEQELLTRYRDSATEVKKRFNILGCPMTTRPLTEFFDLATRYVLPFEYDKKKKGKGFQDAVILSSVLEHLKANTRIAGVFVTGDDVFSKVDIGEFMPSCTEVNLKVLTLEETDKALYDSYWDEHIKKPWKEEEANAKAAVEALMPELRKFIETNIDKSMLRPGTFDKLIELGGIEKVDVFYVTTPIPVPGKPDRTVRIAIAVRALYHAVVEKDLALARALLAGTWADAPAIGPFRSTTEITWTGGVEATAEVEDRKYTSIKFMSLIPSEQLGEKQWLGLK